MTEETPSPAVDEAVWSMVVNRRPWSAGTASPCDWGALGVGRLVEEGLIERRADVTSMQVQTLGIGAIRIHATIETARFERGRQLRAHQTETGCGLRHFLHCDPQQLARVQPEDLPATHTIGRLLDTLFQACRDTAAGGGVHAAGFWHEGELGFVAVDVARHAALERVVGSACDRLDLPLRGGLIVTARMSGVMALLAARAGVGWLASRSIPTRLAVDIAAIAGLTLIARAGTGRLQVIAPPSVHPAP